MPENYSRLKKVTPEEYGMTSSEKSEKYYPRLTLKLKDIPEAKDWEVGETYDLIVEAKMSELAIHSDKEGRVEFEVKRVGYMDDDMEEGDEDEEEDEE